MRAASPWRFPSNSATRHDRFEAGNHLSISLEKVGEGFSITKSHLDLVATIPNADKAKFDAASGCGDRLPRFQAIQGRNSVNARLVTSISA